MNFTPIDLQTWNRGQMFYYFSKMAPTGYSLTVSFSHFSVTSFENKPYYFPSVEAGKYFSVGDRLLMPLSVTCHHATTDGYHVNRFLEAFCRDADNFAEFIR